MERMDHGDGARPGPSHPTLLSGRRAWHQRCLVAVAPGLRVCFDRRVVGRMLGKRGGRQTARGSMVTVAEQGHRLPGCT